MKHRYLEVTFRKGKPLAGYLYLPRPTGSRAARTLDAGHGVRVDVDASGAPIGIEITSPGMVSVAEINAILVRHGVPELADHELAPLAA
jgi:uncharacterized protein YuzE